jgi:hypothetical protein
MEDLEERIIITEKEIKTFLQSVEETLAIRGTQLIRTMWSLESEKVEIKTNMIKFTLQRTLHGGTIHGLFSVYHKDCPIIALSYALEYCINFNTDVNFNTNITSNLEFYTSIPKKAREDLEKVIDQLKEPTILRRGASIDKYLVVILESDEFTLRNVQKNDKVISYAEYQSLPLALERATSDAKKALDTPTKELAPKLKIIKEND